MSEKATDYLILNRDGYHERSVEFFRLMSESETHRKLLLADPVGTLQRVLFPSKDFSDADLGNANRLLFSVLSNQRFMTWARKYQEGLEARVRESARDKGDILPTDPLGEVIDTRQVYDDLLQAILDHGDLEILSGIVNTGGGSIARWVGQRIPRPPGSGTPSGPGGTNWPPGKDDSALAVESVLILSVAVCTVWIVILNGVAVANTVVVGSSLEGGRSPLPRSELQRVVAMLQQELEQRAIEHRNSGASGQ